MSTASTSTASTVDRAAIERTLARISPYLRRTPVLELHTNVQLKLEHLQHSGSFKVRGALANLLTREVPEAGVVAASGGNHGCAVAWAAGRLGVSARIYVPTTSSPAKTERIRGYGAELVLAGERYADALAASEQHVATTGALAVHAFDAPETMCGAGTVGLELAKQAPELDTVLVAVGGGGLIGGIAAWYAGTATRVIAVEPQGSPTLHNALRAGQPVDAATDGIAADALAPRRVGELVFPIAAAHVAAAILVTDDDILAARRALWDSARLLVEPAGACAYAALLAGVHRPFDGERVGVVLSGANTPIEL
ncbi:MAG: threonine/serine dehydratase [Actinomycetota bacterium]|nr:threonine/serine dehydratase [Actinomycetota bacterium]